MLLATKRVKFSEMDHLVNFKSDLMKDLEQDEVMREKKFEDLVYTIKYGVDEKATSADLKPGQILHTISTDDIDRDYEVILPKGADFKWFKKNPVVIWGHNYYDNQNVIGGNVKLMRDEHSIKAITQFDLEMTKAEEIYGQYQRRFLRAWSVGFMELKGRRVPVDEGGAENWPPKAGQIWWEIMKWSMFEYSAVPVPSNPASLTEATAKNFTVDGSVLKDIENFVLKIKEDENERKKVVFDLGSGHGVFSLSRHPADESKELVDGQQKKESEKTEKKEEEPEVKEDGKAVTRELKFDASLKASEVLHSQREMKKELEKVLKKAEKVQEENDTYIKAAEMLKMTEGVLQKEVEKLKLANAELNGRVAALKEMIRDFIPVDPEIKVEEAIVKELTENKTIIIEKDAVMPKDPVVLTLTGDGEVKSDATPKELKDGEIVIKLEDPEKMAENVSKGLDMGNILQVIIDKKRGIVN